MYFSLKTGSQKAYLQWFPFTKLSHADKEAISGEDFYNSYIKMASFMLFPPAMHQSENYLQKLMAASEIHLLLLRFYFFFTINRIRNI